MKKVLLLVTAAAALALAGTAAAALTPWTFDPGNTGCPSSTFSNGVLHLAKNCPTATNASAGAKLTGAEGQAFSSASFTLANAAQCQGGSPRFNVVTSNGTTSTTYFLGCNNVTPTANGDGTATYTFDAASIAAAGGQVPFPAGTITAADVLIDVQGTADLSNITLNGQAQVPAVTSTGPTSKQQCKRGGWKSFTSPTFKNQGQCVSWFEHHTNHGHSH
ncbi:MAG: hypothetical protein ACRDNS_31430 [Trebonia sp.]